LPAKANGQSFRRPLSADMERLLKTGEYEGRYRSRSEPILAVAVAAVNAGWTQAHFETALLDCSNGLSQKMLERGKASAKRYLQTCWTKAVARVTARPAIRDRDAARQEIARIEALLEIQQWKGMGGTTDRAVMKAHLTIANQAGKIEYHADVRTIADLAGVTAPTVARAQKRLRDRGWLRLTRGSKHGRAHVWRLKLPRGLGCNTPTSDSVSPVSNHAALPAAVLPPSGGVRETAAGSSTAGERESVASSSNDQGQGSDAFRWRGRGNVGLGKATERVWRALPGPRTDQISTDLGIGKPMVRRHLRRLRDHGLAAQDESGSLAPSFARPRRSRCGSRGHRYCCLPAP
jgi:transposase